MSREMPPVGQKATCGEGPGEGLQHGDAAGLLGREELQGVVAEMQRLENLTGADDARQQRKC